MSERTMVELVHDALRDRGVDEDVLAAGQFNPRGHTGGLFVGGMIGGELGHGLGELGDAVGIAATGSRIELEGNRLPMTHSADVIDLLEKS